MTITGVSNGSVTRQNIWGPAAPSTSAASSSSTGIVCRPASTTSVMNGVHCQTSVAMTAHSAIRGSASHAAPRTAPRVRMSSR